MCINFSRSYLTNKKKLNTLFFNGDEPAEAGVSFHGVATEKGGPADKTVRVPRDRRQFVLFSPLTLHCSEQVDTKEYTTSLSIRIRILDSAYQSEYKKFVDLARKIGINGPLSEEEHDQAMEDLSLSMCNEMEDIISNVLKSVVDSHIPKLDIKPAEPVRAVNLVQPKVPALRCDELGSRLAYYINSSLNAPQVLTSYRY